MEGADLSARSCGKHGCCSDYYCYCCVAASWSSSLSSEARQRLDATQQQSTVAAIRMLQGKLLLQLLGSTVEVSAWRAAVLY